MNDGVEYITAAGLATAKRKLAELEEKLREIGRIKGEASEGGDWHDNPVFEEMTRQEYQLVPLINDLKNRIAKCVLIQPPSNPTVVELGTRVTLYFKDEFGDGEEEKYSLVGSLEANADEGRISYKSPLGKAILGAKPKQIVKYTLDSGVEVHVKILAIEPL